MKPPAVAAAIARQRNALNRSGEVERDPSVGRGKGGTQSRTGRRMGTTGVSEGSLLGPRVFLKGLRYHVLATCCNFPSVCI